MVVHPAMFRAKPHVGVLLGLILLGGAIGVVMFQMLHEKYASIACGLVAAGSVVWWAVWKIRTLSTALIITNKRTIERHGLLARRTHEVAHNRIEDIEITQTFLQRMWNIGTLGVSSAGESGVEIEVADLPDLSRLRETIDAYRSL